MRPSEGGLGSRVRPAVLWVVALMVAGGFAGWAWLDSDELRTDRFARSVEEMPGVDAVDVEERAGSADRRDLTVDMPADVARREVAEVWRQLADADDAGVSAVTLRIGNSELMKVGAGRIHARQDGTTGLPRALGRLPVETDVSLRDGQPSIVVQAGDRSLARAARQVVDALGSTLADAARIEVVPEGTGSASTINLADVSGSDVAGISRMLRALEGVDAAVVSFRAVSGDLRLEISVSDAAGFLQVARAGDKALAARSDSPDSRLEVTDIGYPGFTFSSRNGEDPGPGLETVDQLRKAGVRVASIDAGRTEIGVIPGGDGAMVGDLTAVLAALKGVRPDLPAAARLSMGPAEGPGGWPVRDLTSSVEVDGSVADLREVVPDLRKATADGYRVGWSTDTGSGGRLLVRLALPEGEQLDRSTLRDAAPVARSLIRDGSATVMVMERNDAPDQDHVRLESTARGEASAVDVNRSGDGAPGMDRRAVTTAWNATADEDGR